jgi:hypothetical protein
VLTSCWPSKSFRFWSISDFGAFQVSDFQIRDAQPVPGSNNVLKRRNGKKNHEECVRSQPESSQWPQLVQFEPQNNSGIEL